MRTIDTNGNEIESYDTEAGVLYETTIVRAGAIPPDGVDKMAYTDDDFEVVQVYEPYTPEQLEFIEQQKRDAEQREADALAARQSAEYFNALTSAFGGATDEQ